MWPRKRTRMETRSSAGRRDRDPEGVPVNLHLLTLPVLVQDHILSYLTISEQLKVRLVCKTTKDWIDQKSGRLSEHIPSTLVRNYGEQTFKVFRGRSVPHVITSFYLENETMDMFNDPTLTKFLQENAHNLKHLRMKRYYICNNNGKQISFLEALPNMEVFEVDEIWISNVEAITTKVPTTFRQLKILKLGFVKVYSEPTFEKLGTSDRIPNERKKILRWHVWNLLDLSLELEFLRVPVSPKFLFDNDFDECFRLLNYIRIRTNGITPRGFRAKQHVMQCDINNFACCTSSLEVLLIVGARMRIQFLNVNSKIFRRGSSFCQVGTPHYARFDFIHSFVSSSLVNRSFEYVQKLTFRASLIQNECIIGREKGPTLFPNLREFHIILDIGCDATMPGALYTRQPAVPGQLQTRYVCLPRADQMLLFFFPDNMEYKFVHTASIIFDDPIYPNQKRSPPEKMISLPKIIKCLPDVRTLTLSGWHCKRDTYFHLWSGFPHLKRLTIESCPTLKPSSFIGGNGNPYNPENFIFLPELNFLEIRGLDNMPGIADETGLKSQMCDVLTKMGLTSFRFLTRTLFNTRVAVWMRSTGTDYKPDPFLYISNSNIITRSVSKAMKRKI